jgi:hypothetical protein
VTERNKEEKEIYRYPDRKARSKKKRINDWVNE